MRAQNCSHTWDEGKDPAIAFGPDHWDESSSSPLDRRKGKGKEFVGTSRRDVSTRASSAEDRNETTQHVRKEKEGGETSYKERKKGPKRCGVMKKATYLGLVWFLMNMYSLPLRQDLRSSNRIRTKFYLTTPVISLQLCQANWDGGRPSAYSDRLSRLAHIFRLPSDYHSMRCRFSLLTYIFMPQKGYGLADRSCVSLVSLKRSKELLISDSMLQINVGNVWTRPTPGIGLRYTSSCLTTKAVFLCME